MFVHPASRTPVALARADVRAGRRPVHSRPASTRSGRRTPRTGSRARFSSPGIALRPATSPGRTIPERLEGKRLRYTAFSHIDNSMFGLGWRSGGGSEGAIELERSTGDLIP